MTLLATPTRKRVLRTINAGATSVADSVVSGAKSVVAALPTAKPTKMAKLRGVATNRKVLIPAIAVVGLGALGYGAYRLVTNDESLFGHYPGIPSDRIGHAGSQADGIGSDHIAANKKIAVADEATEAKPQEDGFTATSSDE